jgi:hypothetical protein
METPDLSSRMQVMVLTTPADGGEARAVRAWLEDAWRHGEIVIESDGIHPVTQEQPVDRFRQGGDEEVQ